MSDRRILCAVVAAGLALAGCGAGGGSGSGTSSRSAFRSSYAAARPGLRSLNLSLEAALSLPAGAIDARIANRLTTLAAAADREAGALEALNPPPLYNTRLRDVGSALVTAALDLGHITTAAQAHDSAALATATRALRADLGIVRSTEATVARSLGLAAG